MHLQSRVYGRVFQAATIETERIMYMKRRIYMAVLAACLVFGSGCGTSTKETAESTESTENTESTESTDDTENTDSTGDTDAEETTDGDTRLVSVSADKMDDYITLASYKGITLTREVEEVTDEDVESQIQDTLDDSKEEVSGSTETVQNGDTVNINFVGKIDGEAFDGGTGNNYDVTIGSGTMISGFEEGIIGMKKGETKDVEVTFPEDYGVESLNGKDAVFEITLQSFRRAPEFTDEWVKENSDYTTMDEYRASVRTQLEEDAETNADSTLRGTGWSTVYKASEVKEYPQEDLDEASSQYESLVQTYADAAGMELDAYVESQGMTTDEFDSYVQQYAQSKVKQNLVIQAIMDAEGITLDDEASLAIQDDLVQQYGSGELATLIDTYGQTMVDETIGLLRIENFILDNANVEQAAAATDTDAEDTAAEDADADTDASAEGAEE